MAYSSKNPPAGSYLKSARNIKIVLVGQARKINGNYADASLTLPDDPHYEIENNDGVLRVVASTSPSNGWLPSGSYRDTCRGLQVLLYADARRVDGTFNSTALDVSGRLNHDIANFDGILVDMADIQAAVPEAIQLLPQLSDEIRDSGSSLASAGAVGKAAKEHDALPLEWSFLEKSTAIQAAPAASVAGATSCESSIATFALAVFFSILGYRDLRLAQVVARNPAIVQGLLGGGGRAAIQEIAREIIDGGAIQRVSAIGRLFGTILSISMAKAIIKAFADTLTAWEGARFAIIAIAQVVVLFSPAGPLVVAARAAQLVLSITMLLEAAQDVKTSCFA